MKPKELKEQIESIFNIKDISNKSRERESIYLRAIYYHIGKNVYLLSVNSLANALYQNHASGLNMLKKHDIEMNSKSIYKFLFNATLTKLSFDEQKNKNDKSITENPILMCILKDLVNLNDVQLKSFRDTRVKPFLKMNQ